MVRVTETSIIAHPVGEVFAVASDPLQQLKWDPDTLTSVEKLTPGPLDRGARFRGTFKGMGTVEYEFAEYEPVRRFAHRTQMRMGEMSHRFTIESVPEGTRLTQVGELRPNLMGWVASPLMAKMLRNRFRVIATELSEYLTHHPRSPEGSSARTDRGGGEE